MTLMTPADVAARWRVHPKTVRALCRGRQLRAMKVGDTWRIAPADVEAYELAHTSEPDAEVRITRGFGVSTTTHRPAIAIDGTYEPVVAGPVPWRTEVTPNVPADSVAARGGR